MATLAGPEAKLPTYIWKGQDQQGNKVGGEIAAASPALAKIQLRRQGFRPIRVKKKSQAAFRLSKPPVKALDVAVFTRQLATMTRAGIPLVKAFEIVAEGLENPTMRELVLAVRDEVSAGNPFAVSLRGHPRQFDELFCNLVAAGEQSGTLDAMLERLATHKEKSEALKSRIKKAMNYPILVMGIAFLVTAVLLIKVVPQFAETFASLGAELPPLTRSVMDLSDFAVAWWPQLAITAGSCFYLLRTAARRSRKFRESLERLALKPPVLGSIIAKGALARFTRTLATTFAAGVPLVNALDSVAGAAGNVVYRTATWRIRDQVTAGQQLAQAMKSTGLFPSMVVQMVAIGEESGTLDAMLDKCANFYEAEVDNAVDGLTAMLEPLIMGTLGILVGGLMVAMYLPIFQIGSAL